MIVQSNTATQTMMCITNINMKYNSNVYHNKMQISMRECNC